MQIKVILAIGILSLIATIVSAIAFFSSFDAIMNSSNLDPLPVSAFVFVVFMILSGILAFIGSIAILATNFDNKAANDSKVLWGLLSLFLLGWIGIIIFACSNFPKALPNALDKKDNF
ncbi:MAG: hypothetical protein ACRDCH_02055 [Metamycoplasmataceae bacterium]